MLSSLLAAALAFTPADASLAYGAAKGLVDGFTPRDAGTRRAHSAANYILDSASAAGADVRIDRFSAATPCGIRQFWNLSAEFVANPTNGWTVFVSHYDTKPGSGCPGANDGASTSGLLVALAGALSRCVREGRPGLSRNVMLLWTDGEECMKAYREDDGLWGSRHAAEAFAREGRKIDAVICLDMLGDRDLGAIVPRNSTPSVKKAILAAAARAGLSDKVAESEQLVKDDHVPFLKKGFPAADVIDFDFGGGPGGGWWHTQEDTMDKVSEKSLLDAGILVVEIIRGDF